MKKMLNTNLCVTNHARQMLVGFLALALAGCSSGKKTQQGGMQAMPVATVALQDTPVADSATYVSTLKSRNSTTIDPQVEGQITKIFVHSGEQVKEGAALMQIDPLKQQ